MIGKEQNTGGVLCWPKRLLSADDLRRHLTNQRELLLLPKTIVTPLALDELKAKGVRMIFEAPRPGNTCDPKTTWIFAQEMADAIVTSAVRAIEREGIALTPLSNPAARALADAIIRHGHRGGIVFTGEPEAVCCIANKVAGIRAGAVITQAQVVRAQKSLGANLFAIEMPGRTFFELRQMLRTIVALEPKCHGAVATTLKELDGHAHR
ncbi:MAG: hypothetical protein HYX68_18175 [Planctomycetes bacterium]|nr:hypothetical protein [Planctomycetota bacterium]